jgi:subtilisin-like proprotein convertase family protein
MNQLYLQRVWMYCVALAVPLLWLSACGGGGSSNAPPVVKLTSIAVGSTGASLKANRPVQLTALGIYSNRSTKDLSASVVWSIGAGSPATVSAGGLVTRTGGSDGDTLSVTATSGTVKGTTTLVLTPNTFTLATGNDPLVPEQWHLKNSGQHAYSGSGGTPGADINVEPVYGLYGVTGAGVKVAVVDSGLEIAHEDLRANVVPGGSWNFATHTTDPTNTVDTSGDHGTSVAGLIAAQWYNGKGGMGVAPDASLQAFALLAPNDQFVATVADAIVALGGSAAAPNSRGVAVFNQSYGSGSITQPQPPDPDIVAQYQYGVTNLRNGKGAIYVKAAGNGYSDYYIQGSTAAANCAAAKTLGVTCENANFDPDNVLPYNIVVGALSAAGTKTDYSDAGSSLWVSAPGGEDGSTKPGIITTDQSGCSTGYARSAGSGTGFNQGQSPNADCSYTNIFEGTSAATPLVSGVVALMLEANPNLTWRDVKHILAATAVPVADARTPITVALSNGNYTAEQNWTTNTAGYHFHNGYGFGRVDAAAAVDMARNYAVNLGTFVVSNGGTPATSGVISIPIPDNNGNGAVSVINVSNAPTFVESVDIHVSATHSYTGDLAIELVSPAGTKSILKNIRDGFASANLTDMALASNAFYGETGNGTWTLRVVDGQSATNTSGGTLTNWKIVVYGHNP